MNKATEPEIVDANLEGKDEPDNAENMEEEQEAGQYSTARHHHNLGDENFVDILITYTMLCF